MGEKIPWVMVLFERARMQGENASLFSPDELEQLTVFAVEYRKEARESDPDWQGIFENLPDHVSRQLRAACRAHTPDLSW